MRWIADIVGCLALAVIVGGLAACVPHPYVSYTGWLALIAVLAIAGLPAWHSKSAPKRPAEWAQLMGWTLLADVVCLLVDWALGAASSRGGSLLQHPGSPLGFGLTAIIIPAAFVIFAAGFVRAIFLVGIRSRTATNPGAGG